MSRAKDLCCSCVLGHAGLPPLGSELQTLCSAFRSSLSSALMQTRHSKQTQLNTNQVGGASGFDILYIDFPLGLNMPFL